jgi:hypothetical protein
LLAVLDGLEQCLRADGLAARVSMLVMLEIKAKRIRVGADGRQRHRF